MSHHFKFQNRTGNVNNNVVDDRLRRDEGSRGVIVDAPHREKRKKRWFWIHV